MTPSEYSILKDISLVLFGAVLGSIVKTYFEMHLRLRLERKLKIKRKLKKQAKRAARLEKEQNASLSKSTTPADFTVLRPHSDSNEHS